jgi:hypothetical protein
MTNTDQKAREIAKYATGWMHPNDSDEVIQQMEDGITERIVALLSRPTPTPERDEVERVAVAISSAAYDAMRAQGFSGGWDHDEFGRAIARAAIAAIPPPIPDRFDARETLKLLEAEYEAVGLSPPKPDSFDGGPVRAALRAITTAHQAGIAEKREWRPIETAPKDGTKLLLTNDRHPQCLMIVGHWAQDLSGEEQPPFQGWFHWSGCGFAQLPDEPTHWQPLPNPPIKENSRGPGVARAHV